MSLVQSIDVAGGTVTVHKSAHDPGEFLGLFEVFGEGIGWTPSEAQDQAAKDARRQVESSFADNGATHIQYFVQAEDAGVEANYYTAPISKRLLNDGVKARSRYAFALYR